MGQAGEGGAQNGTHTGRTMRARRVAVRVVPAGLAVQPGQRMACSMPFDMLNLQDTVEGMVRLMQQQHQ